MDITNHVTCFDSTKHALEALQRLLFCCQCSELTRNVCTLGNCEHIFCKQCVEQRLGARCPVCETPAHARDAQVNRSLSSVVSLSLELGRLLQASSTTEGDTPEGEYEDPATSAPSKAFVSYGRYSSLQKTSTQSYVNPLSNHDVFSGSSMPSPCNEPTSLVTATDTSGLVLLQDELLQDDSSDRQPRHPRQPQKVSERKNSTQLCGDVPPRERKNKVNENKTVPKKKVLAEKSQTPQTRIRSRSRGSTERQLNTAEDSLDHSWENGTEDNTSVLLGQQQALDTPQRRGRRKKLEDLAVGSKEHKVPPSYSNCTSSLLGDNSSDSFPSSENTPANSPASTPVESSESTPGQTAGRSAKRHQPGPNIPQLTSCKTPTAKRGRKSLPFALTPALTPAPKGRQSPSLSKENSPTVKRGRKSLSSALTPAPEDRQSPSITNEETPTVKRGRKSLPSALTPAPKGRQSPSMSNENTPTVKRGRKSLPSALTPAPKGRQSSSLCNEDSQRQKSQRKSVGGCAARVKRNAKGETPLHVAAIKGDLSAVKKLLDMGDNPNVRDNAGWTPLHEAVNHGNTGVTEALLQGGALVNTPGLDNDTPLHDAVTNHRLQCVRLLVAYGANNTKRNVHGRTALELAKTAEMREALQQPALQKQLVTHLPQPEDAEDFLPLCFLGTALDREQRGLLQKCAAKLHAKVVEEYCSEVSHVVSSVNGDGQCPRTMKYLQAVLGGKWILSFDWINICLEYGEKVSEEAFEVPGSSTHPDSNAAHEARINRRLQLPGLFDGCQVYLHGTFARLPPDRRELGELLRLGGAHLLTREPRLSTVDEYQVTVPYHASPPSSLVDCGVFIVHDGGKAAPDITAHRMRSVPAAWVVECIARFSLVEPSTV